MIFKTQYKPRFRGYFILMGLVKILDGFITLLVWPFGYDCDLYGRYCMISFQKDVEWRRKNRYKAKRGNGSLSGEIREAFREVIRHA